MWKKFAASLLRNKAIYATVVLILSVFMGYEASKMQLSYEFPKILPDNDSAFIAYNNFKKTFGEDGSVMVMGFADKDLFQLEKFKDWQQVSKDLKNIAGVKNILSVPTIYNVVRNDSLEKLEFVPLIQDSIRTQADVDSLKNKIYSLPFYEGFLYNKETGANIVAITFNKKDLDSKRRLDMVKEITALGNAFAEKHHVEMHYSGLPYIRAQLMTKISQEMSLFLGLAVLVTAIILWVFFRAFSTVFFSLITTIIGVVWSLGIMQLFGYQITALSGLIAPLVMVIGLPNCIFLINKYQREFLIHGNKIKAIARSVETQGVTLFLANITTSIGFAVLYFTKSSMLVEFGVVASISVMVTYFITLIMIPIILNILPTPKAKYTKHQEGKRINGLLNIVDKLVQNHRAAIYATTTVLTIICIFGMRYIDLNGYVVDDLPSKDPVYTHLHFFEDNFKGVLPFEISVDTKKPNGLFADNARAIYKIKLLQRTFEEYDIFSKPLSIVEGIKFSYQAYKGGNPKFYKVPAISDLKTLSEYQGSLKGQGNKLQNFVDSTKQTTRISYQARDIGSKEMKDLLTKLRPRVDSIFPPQEYEVNFTGHSLVFLKSNDYLLSNLIESLIIEIILIAIVGMALFRSVRIILLSKLPCLIPLVVTAGVMGFLDIRFKPSTILIFSIAFGISSDGTVYFLSKYRQELKRGAKSASAAISAAIKETGLSMVYTSTILFFGFSIFSASGFGGTQAMGVLVSLTLLMSMFTNLILLPAILLSIHTRQINKELTEEPLVNIEEEDEED